MAKLIQFLLLAAGTLLLFGCNNDPEPLLIEGEEPEIITGDYQFTEGPYWHPDGFLIFSDIPANTVYRWSEDGGADVFLEPSGNSNGIQADLDGNIILAQHRGSVSKLDQDGELTVLVDNYEGNRLNSPNDIAVHSNGNIYFTDPPFGVDEEDREIDFSGVYKLSPVGELTLIYDELALPNGLVFSSDESQFFLNDSETGDILIFQVGQDGMPNSPQLFANVGEMSSMGGADGMVTDLRGNLFTTGPNGLTIFNQDGEQLHLIEFDEQITNLEWGGEDLNELFITGSDNVYRLLTNTIGNKKR